MAEYLNQANVSYTYTGARAPSDSDSNITTTNVLSATSISISKTPLGDTYIPGENHSFVIRIENTGTTPVDNVVLQDNLGEITDGTTTTSLMNYIIGSGLYSLNDSEWTPVDPTGVDPITIAVGTLQAGDVYIFAYTANIIANTTQTSITNTATVSGDASGTPVSDNAESTITESVYASVNVEKFGSDTDVIVGENFSYTLILTNTGNTEATDIVVSDNLPDNFTLESITYTDPSGNSVILDPSDYNVTGNTLTIPSSTSTLDLTIPARTDVDSGRIIFVLNGRFTE